MTSVPLTALTSGARITDLFALPVWLWIPYRMVRWIFRHWYVALILTTMWFMPWQYVLISILSLPLILFTYVYAHNPRHRPTAVARAALYLSRARMNWRRACESAELTDGPRSPRLVALWPSRPPRIANETGTSLTFTINLARVGLTVNNLEDNKDYIAAALDARRTRIHRLTPGVAKFTIEWEKRLSRSVVANPTHQINTTQLPRVELDQDVFLELDTSLLVVGESGSGKSNLTWVILNKLNELQVHYRLYVIDPKKVELAELVDSPYTVAYSDMPSTIDSVIDRFYDDMMATFERMKENKERMVQLGERNPLNILVIDELLLCRQAHKGIDSHLGEVLSAGRAAGFIVIADSQLGQVDALSRIRDLFPQRICMAVKSEELTTAVLGPKAEARGARCTEITEKGVGYVFTDFTGAFQRFKPPFIADVFTVAQGGFYQEAPVQNTFGWGRRKV